MKLYHLSKKINFKHDIKVTQLIRELFLDYVCESKEKYHPLKYFQKYPYSHT